VWLTDCPPACIWYAEGRTPAVAEEQAGAAIGQDWRARGVIARALEDRGFARSVPCGEAAVLTLLIPQRGAADTRLLVYRRPRDAVCTRAGDAGRTA
jgi:hypothetical protein